MGTIGRTASLVRFRPYAAMWVTFPLAKVIHEILLIKLLWGAHPWERGSRPPVGRLLFLPGQIAK